MDTTIFVCKLEWKEPQRKAVTICSVNSKVLKKGDTHHAFCHKSVKLTLNNLTLGVTSDSVSEVNSLVEIVLGAKRILKTCLYYLKRHGSSLVALNDLRMHPLYNVSCNHS